MYCIYNTCVLVIIGILYNKGPYIIKTNIMDIVMEGNCECFYSSVYIQCITFVSVQYIQYIQCYCTVNTFCDMKYEYTTMLLYTVVPVVAEAGTNTLN